MSESFASRQSRDEVLGVTASPHRHPVASITAKRYEVSAIVHDDRDPEDIMLAVHSVLPDNAAVGIHEISDDDS